MGQNSKIEWTHHTFNPWWGCVKIAPECANCYAATFSHRLGKDLWGPDSARQVASEKGWKEPIKWNASAVKRGVRERVFCASMADVFESNEQTGAARERLWKLIEATPQLDWLLLTKRPENILGMIPSAWMSAPRANVWFGTSAGCQATADKNIPALLKVPASVLFVSAEPLLGPVDFRRFDFPDGTGAYLPLERKMPGIDWIIVGGESGPGARPMNVNWARSIQKQCEAAAVAFHFKQWGEHDQTGARVGKHEAGRLLDGREYNEFPVPRV